MKEIEARLIFGTELKKIRNSRGLTVRGFAKLVGFSAPYICDLESGNRKPTLEMINKFSKVLILTEEEKKLLNDGYAFAHPGVVIPPDIMYYILENNLVDTLRDLKSKDKDGTKIKKLVLTINENE